MEEQAHTFSQAALARLAEDIKRWAHQLGFGRVGVADLELSAAEAHLQEWLQKGFHGELHYMARHGALRTHPADLVPGTVRVVALGMDYLPDAHAGWVDAGWHLIADPARANVSLYARGRDYHKVIRQRLQYLAERIAGEIGPFGYRVFTDSAPILEVELARKAGLGWRGKHTLLLSRQGGSMFFLGEIFVDLPLPVDAAQDDHCGRCTRCIEICPTRAIVAPYQLDARRCISYLTIELHGSIPEEYRHLIGNRVYGCDDCQLACPWNKFAQSALVDDFHSRGLENLALVEAFRWDEPTFLERTQGSPIRRIGHERWLRNVAVALGNALRAPGSPAARALVRQALRERIDDPSALVREHVAWALRDKPDDLVPSLAPSAR
jgi:epoxyqueuosine reductase